MDGAWDMEPINPKSPGHSLDRKCLKLFFKQEEGKTLLNMQNIWDIISDDIWGLLRNMLFFKSKEKCRNNVTIMMDR